MEWREEGEEQASMLLEKPERIVELCVQMGTELLNCGAETSRVEETVRRVAHACGATVAQGFATPTGLFITIGVGGNVATRLCRVYGSGAVDLNKVALLNDVSRSFVCGRLTFDEAVERVKSIAAMRQAYSRRIQIIAAGLASGSFAFLFHAGLSDVLLATIAGSVAFTVYDRAETRVPPFVAVFIAALCSVAMVACVSMITPRVQLDRSVIGAMFPLVPGLAVTNSIRDVMAGDLLAGLARAADAFLTAMALATAVVVVLALLHR